MKLKLSSTLMLPPDAVTQTLAILGKRGSGKTNTSVVLTEEMLTGGQHVVILDPLDVWWGLRSSADGKAPGLAITVLGGNHADLPLEAGAGSIIADFVVEQQASIILSLRHFSNADQRRFVTDFCERLFYRKGEPGRAQPLHLVLDEADEYVPQRIMSGQERMFGSIDRIVRRGRASGLGVTLISQRAAVVNKDVLTQIEVLVCHRTVSPQDRKALEAWIEAHDARNQRGDFMESLASLAIGEAWFWSPGWLDIFQRVKIRARRTFDSSATPVAGAKVVAPKHVAQVDLEQLRQQMADTIERAKADDPRELRALLRAWQKQWDQALSDLRAIGVVSEEVAGRHRFRLTAPTMSSEQESEIRKEAARSVHERYGEVLLDIGEAADKLNSALKLSRSLAEFVGTITSPKAVIAPPSEKVRKAVAAVVERSRSAASPSPKPENSSSYRQSGRAGAAVAHTSPLPAGERAVLTVCAQYPAGATREQISILTGYKRSSRDAYIQRLRSHGLVEAGSVITATAAGIAALGPDFEPLPTGEALQRYWLDRLPEGERKVLEVVIEYHPRAVEREEIDQRTGYKRSSRDAYIQRLKARQLVVFSGRGEVRGSEVLFA